MTVADTAPVGWAEGGACVSLVSFSDSSSLLSSAASEALVVADASCCSKTLLVLARVCCSSSEVETPPPSAEYYNKNNNGIKNVINIGGNCISQCLLQSNIILLATMHMYGMNQK